MLYNVNVKVKGKCKRIHTYLFKKLKNLNPLLNSNGRIYQKCHSRTGAYQMIIDLHIISLEYQCCIHPLLFIQWKSYDQLHRMQEQ